jgi:hypothetical protein
MLLEHFNSRLFDHPSYNPYYTLSDYHLFTHTYLKNWLHSQHFNNNEELMEGVKVWLGLDLFGRGLQKLTS